MCICAPVHRCHGTVCVRQTAASAKELEQYHSDAQVWLELLEDEVKQGENLKEEDFLEDKVCYPHTKVQSQLV